MLSFDPNNPFGGVNLGLDDSFKAQTEGAELAKYMTDDQFKLISKLNDPTTSLAYQKAAANAGANVPQMKFGGENLAEGLGNGINNYTAMRGYKQQQQTYRDIATQQDAYQQKQLELMNNQIDAQNQEIETGSKQLPVLLPNTPPEQILALQAANRASGGKLFAEISTRLGQGQTDVGLIAPKSQAEGQAKLKQAADERTAKEQQFQEMTGKTVAQFLADVNRKQVTPQEANIWKYTIGGDIPMDLVDYQNKRIESESKKEGLYTQQVNNETLPQMNVAELDGRLISNSTAQIKQALDQLRLNTEPERLAEEADARHWTQQERIKKAKEADRVRQIVNDTNILLGQGKLTPTYLVTAQTALRALGAGDALDPIVSNFQSVSKDNKTSKAEAASSNANNAAQTTSQAIKTKQKQLQEQGFQKSPSGMWYNPTTREWRK